MAPDRRASLAAGGAAVVLLVIASTLLIRPVSPSSQTLRKPSAASDEGLRLVDFDQQGDRLDLTLTNAGAAAVTVAQVQVDAAYWEFRLTPGTTIAPAGRATLTLAYSWDQSQPLDVNLVASSGAITTVTLDPETGAYRVPVKSWRLLTTRQLVTTATIAAASTLLAWFLLAAVVIPGAWRDALLTAASAVAGWQILGMIVLDPNTASIRPGVWQGTTPLFLSLLLGLGAAWIVRGAIDARGRAGRGLWFSIAAAIACHMAAAGMSAADLAGKGQDDLIVQVLRQLLVVVGLRACVGALADGHRGTMQSWLLPASLAGVVAAALISPLAAPSVRFPVRAAARYSSMLRGRRTRAERRPRRPRGGGS